MCIRDSITAGHTAGVEGTHGQLGAGLTDGLGGDDTHRLASAHRLTNGQVDAVALGAHAAAGPAGKDRADLHFMDTVFFQSLGVLVETVSYTHLDVYKRQ